MERVYLDWNASAPLCAPARMAAMAAMDSLGNPSSVHAEGRVALGIIETARGQVMDAFGVGDGDIIFTSGATEAAALALAGRDVVCTAIEHPCVLAQCHVDGTVGLDGQALLDGFASRAVQTANSETGILQVVSGDYPSTSVGQTQKQPTNEKPASQGENSTFKFCDAVQSFGKIPNQFNDLHADMAILSAHKIGGLKGAGALVISKGLDVAPLLKGGGQEQGRRSGTQNLIGIAAFGAAAEFTTTQVKQGVWDEVATIRDDLQDMLCTTAPDAVIIGRDVARLPNTICIAVAGWDAALQVMQMDLAGFAISAGSACSSGKIKAGATLPALGIDPATASCAIRLSLGPLTTQAQAMAFATAWGQAYHKHTQKHDIKNLAKAS